MKYYVKIMERETDKIVQEIECKSYREADKVEDGVNINLNHEGYYTDIIKGDE